MENQICFHLSPNIWFLGIVEFIPFLKYCHHFTRPAIRMNIHVILPLTTETEQLSWNQSFLFDCQGELYFFEEKSSNKTRMCPGNPYSLLLECLLVWWDIRPGWSEAGWSILKGGWQSLLDPWIEWDILPNARKMRWIMLRNWPHLQSPKCG
jgi:hypothetical protein